VVWALLAQAVVAVEAPAVPAHGLVEAEVDVDLAAFAAAAYGDVLDAAAVDAAAVALEVAHHYHGV